VSAPDLAIILRVYVKPKRATRKRRRGRSRPKPSGRRWPAAALVFDTETSIDPTQRLLFGSYHYARWTRHKTLHVVEEGLFYADELPETNPTAFATLKTYARTHEAEVGARCDPTLRLHSRAEFVERVFWRALQARSLVVGFNLPFDLSRIAVECGEARGQYRGGFSFTLSAYRDAMTGVWRENPYRSRVCVKHIDGRRSFIGVTRPRRAADNGRRGTRARLPPSRFLDPHTLTFALTNENHTLASAGESFRIEHAKLAAGEHGVITSTYIDYNRRDVLATLELLEKLRAEFDRHPVDLDPCQALSPASLAKAYLRAMGVIPLTEKCR